MGFAMSEEDLFFVRQHYSEDLLRDPTVTELRVIDTYWSDHCRHTTFSTEITDVTFGTDKYSQLLKKAYDRYLEIRKEVYGERIAEKDITLMDLAVIGTKYVKKLGLADDLDESEEINACSINVTAEIDGKKEDWLVMVSKMKPTIIRRKSNLSAVRLPVWAERSAIRFPGVSMCTKRCA